jgi:hypothetical protein
MENLALIEKHAAEKQGGNGKLRRRAKAYNQYIKRSIELNQEVSHREYEAEDACYQDYQRAVQQQTALFFVLNLHHHLRRKAVIGHGRERL